MEVNNLASTKNRQNSIYDSKLAISSFSAFKKSTYFFF